MSDQKEEIKEPKEMLTRLIFECNICRKVFPEPGICQKCDIVLKPKAA